MEFSLYDENGYYVRGKDDAASLLYDPDEIFSIRSCDLKREYKEGIDYEVKDGKILLTENTSIPYMTVEEYYPDKPISGGSFSSRLPDHPNLRFGEGDTFTRYQVYVTYSHREHWDRYVPEGQSEKFPHTIQKLQNGEPTTILFFGDSITEGYNSSGFIGVEPFADSWAQMMAKYLGKYYGNDRVRYINTGLAGQNCDWALSTVQKNVIDYAPRSGGSRLWYERRRSVCHCSNQYDGAGDRSDSECTARYRDCSRVCNASQRRSPGLLGQSAYL